MRRGLGRRGRGFLRFLMGRGRMGEFDGWLCGLEKGVYEEVELE